MTQRTLAHADASPDELQGVPGLTVIVNGINDAYKNKNRLGLLHLAGQLEGCLSTLGESLGFENTKAGEYIGALREEAHALKKVSVDWTFPDAAGVEEALGRINEPYNNLAEIVYHHNNPTDELTAPDAAARIAPAAEIQQRVIGQ